MTVEAVNDRSSSPHELVPPLPKGSYRPGGALEDIPGISYALHLFLASHMVESEEYCIKSDPKKERLYFATGYGLIQCVKALMSYEDEDLLAALNHIKHGNAIAIQHRKRAASLPTRLAGLVVGSLNTSGVGFIKSMTNVERHAELVYAESLFEKALIGIVYSGDWLAFVKEAMNMRTCFNIYRQLGKYLDAVDAEALARGKGSEDKSVDPHFRSGVYLGLGISNLILSLLPSKVLTIVELFGYKGDRQAALSYLMRSGGWSTSSSEPAIGPDEEGVRRTICDMALLIFHLVLSGMTFEGVDVDMAEHILNYNLKRYPNGVFFLLSQGRLSLCRSQPAQAIEWYQKAINSQNQYRNLHHISYWEMATSYLALWDVPSSLGCWQKLGAEATWSKACYAYAQAVCLLELGSDDQRAEAAKLMEKVPGLRQRIAGKSIPLEKFIARKARKFQDQGNRLTLAAMEFSYLFPCISRAPRGVITSKMLPRIEEVLMNLEAQKDKPSGYKGGTTFWDDLCLARFLKGVCLRYVAYPDTNAVVDASEQVAISQPDAERGSLELFQSIFTDGPKIALDHYLVYCSHYEIGRVLARSGDVNSARKHFELVLSGKSLEVNASTRKGKYSMESANTLRSHAALEALDQGKLL